jgi:heme exporter protein A
VSSAAAQQSASEPLFTSVTARKISKIYERRFAVHEASLQLDAGSITGIAGHNGAGKTTLLSLLSTLTAPSRGELLFDDIPVSRWNRTVLRREIGLLGHHSFLYPDMDGEENLRFFGQLYGFRDGDLERRVREALEAVDMWSARRRRVKHCSRGMVQRVALARVYVQDPMLWLLDEPTTGLDTDTKGRLLDVVRAQRDRGRIVAVISHERDTLAALSDRMLVLRRGRIEADQ